MTDDLSRHFIGAFGLLLAGLLIALLTPHKLEGISIQLLGGFWSVIAGLAIIGSRLEDE
jgi:hypothetical protein